MTTGKTTALTKWAFVGKVMSLLFIMLSRLVIAFLSRNKRLLISWMVSLILYLKKNHQNFPGESPLDSKEIKPVNPKGNHP